MIRACLLVLVAGASTFLVIRAWMRSKVADWPERARREALARQERALTKKYTPRDDERIAETHRKLDAALRAAREGRPFVIPGVDRDPDPETTALIAHIDRELGVEDPPWFLGPWDTKSPEYRAAEAAWNAADATKVTILPDLVVRRWEHDGETYETRAWGGAPAGSMPPCP